MDQDQARKMVFTKIQTLDPENASKIIGYLLIHGPGEKYMLNLALGSEQFFLKLIHLAKSNLGISSNASVTQNGGNSVNFEGSSDNGGFRELVTRGGGFTNFDGENNNSGHPQQELMIKGGSGPNFVHRDNNGGLNDSKINDFNDPQQELMMRDHLGHRRSVSLNDASLGNDVGGRSRICAYYAKGFCKNGSKCTFRHGLAGGDSINDASGIVFQQQQQQRMMVPHMMMGAGARAVLPYNKCMHLINQTSRSAAAATLMMDDEFRKFGRSGNHISSQIYLTFPSESSFTDEDVTKYFSQFGPVEDVRIPYQQKRMFGFVTFVYPETVRHILTKGNPHFICESRVLVKPYKVKGNGNEDKKHNHHHQQQFDLRELPGGPSPGEPYGVHIGPRKFINDQGLMLRRLEEHTFLQHQIIEAQARRMKDLQLQNEIINHQVNQYPQDHSLIDPRDSHIPAFLQMNQNLIPEGPKDYPTAFADQQVQHRVHGMHNGSENRYVKEASLTDLRSPQVQNVVNEMHHGTNGGGNGHVNEESSSEFDLSFEHLLPDDLFSSPKKHAANSTTAFSNSFPPEKVDESVGPQILGSVEMPRLSSGHDDAIEKL